MCLPTVVVDIRYRTLALWLTTSKKSANPWERVGATAFVTIPVASWPCCCLRFAALTRGISQTSGLQARKAISSTCQMHLLCGSEHSGPATWSAGFNQRGLASAFVC